MLDSIYHMTLKLLNNCILGENVKILPFFHNFTMHIITLRYQICKPLVVYRFYCMELYHSHMRCHVIKLGTIPSKPSMSFNVKTSLHS